jgi:hypothetical protein
MKELRLVILVKLADGRIVVVETKGQVDEDVPQKIAGCVSGARISMPCNRK